MFVTPGEFTEWLASWPKELWSGLGSFVIAVGLGIVAKISASRADADKAARPVTPPEMASADPASTGVGGMTFLHDASTERDILTAVRESLAALEGIHEDQRAWYASERERRTNEDHKRVVDENGELREEVAKLRAGQMTSHDNQRDIKQDTGRTERLLVALLKKLDVDPAAL